LQRCGQLVACLFDRPTSSPSPSRLRWKMSFRPQPLSAVHGTVVVSGDQFITKLARAGVRPRDIATPLCPRQLEPRPRPSGQPSVSLCEHSIHLLPTKLWGQQWHLGGLTALTDLDAAWKIPGLDAPISQLSAVSPPLLLESSHSLTSSSRLPQTTITVQHLDGMYNYRTVKLFSAAFPLCPGGRKVPGYHRLAGGDWVRYHRPQLHTVRLNHEHRISKRNSDGDKGTKASFIR
jgi:hypothetical protein